MSDDWNDAPNAEDKYDDYLDANGLMVCNDCGDECPENDSDTKSCETCQEQREFEETLICM